MDPETLLAAAVDEWADALKVLGEELLKVAEVTPWLDIFVNLWSLSWDIVGTVGCFIAQGYLAGAFVALNDSAASAEGCCGGAAIELAFDPVTQLLIPMVNGATWLTVVITGVVVGFGPFFVGQIPNMLEIADTIAGELCSLD